MPIINNPKLRNRADQAEILLAFAQRLREYPQFSEQTVVISDQPMPEQFPGGGYCLTVSPGAGTFPQEFWTGGHHATATEDGSVIVGIFVRKGRDRPGRNESVLLGRWWHGKTHDREILRPSLLLLKRTVLSLLTVQDPSLKHASQAWEPSTIVPSKDQSGNDIAYVVPLCRDQVSPVRCTQPLDVPGQLGWIGMEVTFSVAWDWDLYTKING